MLMVHACYFPMFLDYIGFNASAWTIINHYLSGLPCYNNQQYLISTQTIFIFVTFTTDPVFARVIEWKGDHRLAYSESSSIIVAVKVCHNWVSQRGPTRMLNRI